MAAMTTATTIRTTMTIMMTINARQLFLEFVSALLAVDPDQRPTAEQALKHPWLQEILPCAQYQLPS
jgi:serine/threonine protein kinase